MLIRDVIDGYDREQRFIPIGILRAMWVAPSAASHTRHTPIPIRKVTDFMLTDHLFRGLERHTQRSRFLGFGPGFPRARIRRARGFYTAG